jgi:protein ImuB
VQHDLYTPPSPEPERLELTLQKIRGFVGADKVGSPEMLNTHRSDAWVLRRLPSLEERRPKERAEQTARLSFRFYRPAREAQVEVRAETPRVVRARGLAGRVLQSAGPWIRSGDWWSQQMWSRREWDVGLDSGGLYRIYQTRVAWFVEGSYD